ncbi:MAG TPA: sigma-54 dependent transcriptional regulator, partial [Myxococcota bacterium]|nr:sigma-54 dependent transcriptional regulator [Myxococcota bacterium]
GTLGGAGATWVVDPLLPADAASVRLSRGRPMIDRGAVPVFLEGAPISDRTPLVDGDTLRVGRAVIEVSSVVGAPPRSAPPRGTFGEMVGQSEIMLRLFDTLARVAAHDAPVLLTGESGTGKELAARGLHEHSGRGSGPFVAINCAAIPQALAESQLFGHERGAFTGAEQRRDGAFQRAHRGTLFLDELGEMTLDAQARLLRALESGEVMRVGGAEPEYPDVRVVAATNRALSRMVEEGTFRRDLYYRLAVLTVRLPSLRERPDDLPKLVAAILERHHAGARIRPAALAMLRTHGWPGNVRELRNVLTRAVVLGGDPIDVAHLQFNAWSGEEPRAEEAPRGDDERALLLDTLARFEGNRTLAARALGIPRTSLLYKIMRYGLDG